MPGQPQAQSSTQQSQAAHVNQARRLWNWASVRPLLISHACLDKLMTPTVLNTIGGHNVLVTPLEQFLSCHLLLIYFKKVITPKYGKTLVSQMVFSVIQENHVLTMTENHCFDLSKHPSHSHS